MEWNCPHCSTGLSVSDSNLGNTWSFARCYQCKNFSLINKADSQNIIRVDSPPESEEAQSFVINESGQVVEKPVIKPAIRKPTLSTEATDQASKDQTISEFPDPLPDLPEPSAPSRLLPVISSLAGGLILMAGAFIYMANHSGIEAVTELQSLQRKGAGKFEAIEMSLNSETPTAQAPEVPTVAKEEEPKPHFQFQDTQSSHTTVNSATPSNETRSTATIFIRSKQEGTMFYGGPGLGYPVLGALNPSLKYSIAETKNEWFKVQSEESKVVYGWIRNTTVDYVAVEKNSKVDSQNQ